MTASRLSFPLQSLPDVAVRALLQKMTPSAIFLLSMCSRRTKKILKQNMFKPDEVWMEFFSMNGKVTFSIEWEGKSFNVLHLDPKKSSFDEKRQIIEEWGAYSNYRFSQDAVNFHTCRWTCIRTPIQSIHSYLCDLFRINPNTLSVITNGNLNITYFEKRTVKKCVILEGCDIFSNDTNDFFKDQQTLNTVTVKRSMDKWRIFNDHELLNVPVVAITSCGANVSTFICRFQGIHGLFENSYLHDYYVKALLRRWSLKKCENLETFIAYQGNEGTFDSWKVLEHLDAYKEDSDLLKRVKVESWDPAKRERFYKFKAVIPEHRDLLPDTFDCRDGIDIIRESDGKRATVKVSDQFFMFFVWP